MRPGRPRDASGDQTLCGVYYGVVTQNKDSEKSLARIKVKLPWLDNSDQDQAYWAQLSTPMSGNEFGFYCLPDVGDVVAVMFIAGDINHPVVLGGVWSKTDAAPEPNAAGGNDFRGYRSRAGSRVVLDDSAQGKLMLADKTNKNVVAIGSLSKGGSGDNASEPPKPAGGGATGALIAAADGKLNITCKKGKLKVSGLMVKIAGKNGVEMTAGGDLEMEGALAQVGAGGNFNGDGSSAKIGP